MKKTIGTICICSSLAIVLCTGAIAHGLQATLVAFGMLSVIVGLVFLGLYLIISGEEKTK